MPRLPQLGGDYNTWGAILNDYLSQSHEADGSIKQSALAHKADAAHTHTAAQLSDASDIGKQLVQAGDAVSARSVIGAGTSNFDGLYSSLSGRPTLGTAASAAASDFATALQGAKADAAVVATAGMIIDALADASVVGDGIADDSAALSNLITQAAAYGGTILLGEHAISTSLSLPDGVCLQGRNSDSRLTIPSGAAFPAVIIDAAQRSEIRRLKFTANGSTVIGACAVSVRGNAQDILLEDLHSQGLFEGFRLEGGAGILPGLIRRIVLSRCHALSSDQYGFRVDDCDGLELLHCTSVGSGLDGVKLRKKTKNVTVTGGQFTGAVSGDGLDAYAGGDSFIINGGLYNGNGVNGITIKTDDLNKTDAVNFGYVRNVSLFGVRADGNNGNGLAIHRNAETDDITEPLVARVTVHGGTFSANGERGIFLRARQVCLAGPAVARNGMEGIDVQEGSVDVTIVGAQIAGNSVTSPNARDGVRIAGARVQLIGGSSIGADPDGATSDADVAAGSKTQRYGVRVEATAAGTIVSGISLYHNVTLPFTDSSGTAYILPGYSDDATWPQISIPNNKRLYTRTAAGGFASALYMTTGNALNIGDSTNTATLSFLASSTVDVFPQLRALHANGIKLGSLTADPTITKGAGTPEGAFAAPVGSLRMRTDGGAGTTLYIKESGTGTTGWRAV